MSDNHLHDDNSSEARVAWLLSARAVREQAQAIFAATLRGDSEHFTIDERALPRVVERVARVTQANYPDFGAIPYHSRLRHFGVGGVDRWAQFEAQIALQPALARLRARMDLVITSVLLATTTQQYVLAVVFGVIFGAVFGLMFGSWPPAPGDEVTSGGE